MRIQAYHCKLFQSLLYGFSLFFAACSSGNEPDLCFIGDSITHLWDTSFFFPEYSPANHGINGAKIEDTFKWDLSECKGIPSIILIGTNNLNKAAKNASTKAAFLEEYTQMYMSLLDKIQASNYFIISILPRNRLYEENGALNDYIKRLNDALKEMLKGYPVKNTFIDAYPEFLKDSAIIREYYSDGLHLSEEGYDLLSSLVRSAI